jgi:hypothetical protein
MVLAFLVALVVALLYEYAVFEIALRDFHAAHSVWLKPQEELPRLRMFLTLALNLALVTLFYALFARHRASRLSTGLVFGVLLGLIAGWVPQAFNKMLFVNYPFYLHWGTASFVETVLVGAVLGLVYRE